MKKACLYALFAASLTATAAHADTVVFTLSSPTASTTAGGTATYSATISAPLTNGAPVFLNGDTITLSDPTAVSYDDSGLFGNFPASLNPGDSKTEVLFTLSAAAGTMPGMYSGSYVLEGGADANAQTVLDTEPFTFDVTAGAASVTPEPSSVLLLSTGMLGIVALSLRKRLSAGI
jgi:opacity protein-like surface antigen